MYLLESFFKENEESLKRNYPGIKLTRLIDEWKILQESSGFEASMGQFIQGLTSGVPLEYLSGVAYFYSSYFYVNENVLIPRSETEILVEKALSLLKPNDQLIDVGTGSACIPLSIANEFDGTLSIIASDLSRDALEVAKRNEFLLRRKRNPETKIVFFESDRLEKIEGKFNLITSNPPYIKRESDRELVHSQVLKYEPHMALFLDDESYQSWFETFFKQVFKHLESEVNFLMEGHEEHLDNLALIAEQSGLKNVKIEKDLGGKKRFLFAQKIK